MALHSVRLDKEQYYMAYTVYLCFVAGASVAVILAIAVTLGLLIFLIGFLVLRR